VGNSIFFNKIMGNKFTAKLSEIAQKSRNNSFIGNVYLTLPRIMQNLFYTVYGIFKLIEYRRILNDLSEYDQEAILSPKAIKNKQVDRLKLLLHHAIKHSPYYRNIISKYNIDNIKDLSILNSLPILSKEKVLENYSNIITENSKEFSPIIMSSGGTTGTTLNFMVDKGLYLSKEQQVASYWKRHDYIIGKEKTLMYRAGVLQSNSKKINKPWRRDYARKMLYLSSYYASDKLYKEYHLLLQKWKPKYMQCLPSAVFLFAKYLNNNNLSVPLKKVFSASETLHEFQRVEIEKAFSCKVFDHYGHGEPGIYAAGQCEKSHYHIPSNDVIVEVLEDGNILETSLKNYSMPFIRYQIGDIIDGVHDDCECGITTPYIKKILGRESSLIYTGDGRVLSSIGFDQVFKMNNIILGQIIQNERGKLKLKLIPGSLFSKNDEKNILNKLKDRVGLNTQITIEYVKEIPKAKSGKYNLVISNIKEGVI